MENQKLMVTSVAFPANGDIPVKYTCDGEEVSPPLRIESIPDGTMTLALIVEDPDAPKGIFDHWIVWNIDPTSEIGEGTNPGISGNNGAGKTGYHGPCPPNGNHRYYFYVFALDSSLDLPVGSSKDELKQAMEGHIIAKGNLMGNYKSPGKEQVNQ